MSRKFYVMAITLVPVVVLMTFTFFLVSKQPTQVANWKTQYHVLPTVQLSGDTITITNFRDFRYSSDGNIAEARYRTAQFQLSQLQGVWLGISHFGSWDLAHALVSFQFGQDQYLTVSIEARLTEQQISYAPITGLFRNYTKFMALGSEQDIIGLRSHIRKEEVYLYPLQGSELQAKTLLLSYLRQAQSLNTKPEFYNTLFDNCLTGLLAESKQYRGWWRWFDYRILLPGYADHLLLQDGVILDRGGVSTTRTLAKINSTNSEIESKHFSRAIRPAPIRNP